jgi:hypothetical protein
MIPNPGSMVDQIATSLLIISIAVEDEYVREMRDVRGSKEEFIRDS